MTDRSAFLIRNANGEYLCPVCGFAGAFFDHSFVVGPDGLDHGKIGTGICDCCYFEPGFDDDPLASEDAKATLNETVLDYRAKWIAEGMPFQASERPGVSDWQPHAQLSALYALTLWLEPLPVICGFDKHGEPLLHRRQDGAIEIQFQFMPPETTDGGERSPELFTAFEHVLSEALGVTVVRDDREQFLIAQPKPDTAAQLAAYLSTFWRDHAPVLEADLRSKPPANDTPFRSVADYRTALRDAVEPRLRPLGFKCSITPNLVFRKKTSFGFWGIEFQIGLERNSDAIEPAVFYSVQHAAVENLLSLCFDRDRKYTKVAPTMNFRWVKVPGESRVACADDVLDWVSRLAPLIDSEILPGLEQWSDLAAIERAFNSQAVVPPNYAQWFGVATYPAAQGILAARLLDRDDVETSIAFHLAHLGDADHYGYFARTVTLVRDESAARLAARAGIMAHRFNDLEALRTAVRATLSPWLATLGFAHFEHEDQHSVQWQRPFEHGTQRFSLILKDLGKRLDVFVAFYIHFELIERIYASSADGHEEDVAAAATVFDVVTEPIKDMLARPIKTRADLDEWTPKFQAFFENVVLPDMDYWNNLERIYAANTLMAESESNPLEGIMADRYAGKAIIAAKLLGLPELESILDFHDAAITTYNPGKGEADERDRQAREDYARLSALIRGTSTEALIKAAKTDQKRL